MKWIKIDEKNKPVFGKHYLLGKEKKGWFGCEKVYFGWLDEIRKTESGERYIYRCEKKLGYGEPNYYYTSDISHFIEIEHLPNVA